MSSSKLAVEILSSLGIHLDSRQVEQVLLYTETLLKWNRGMNLTRITEEGAIYREHFGESFQLQGWLPRQAFSLIDVGSGAGFPGLALKILRPELRVTLLEASAKKTLFLREVAGGIGLGGGVEVIHGRLAEWAVENRERAEVVTVRGVHLGGEELDQITGILRPEGRLVVVTSARQAESLSEHRGSFRWDSFFPLSGTSQRGVLAGMKVSRGTVSH